MDSKMKNLIFKIGLPLLILLIVVGIAVAKNAPTVTVSPTAEAMLLPTEDLLVASPMATSDEILSAENTPTPKPATLKPGENPQKTMLTSTAAPQKVPNIPLIGTDSLDVAKLKSYGLPIILDFGAEWCPPCKEFKPIFTALYNELKGRAILVLIDVDNSPEITGKYPVRVIPTQVLIDAGGNAFSPSANLSFDVQKYPDRGVTVHEGGLTRAQMLELLKEMGMK